MQYCYVGIPILKKEKKSKNEKKNERRKKERKSNAYAPPYYKWYNNILYKYYIYDRFIFFFVLSERVAKY